MKTKINKLAAQIIIEDWYTTNASDFPARYKGLAAESMTSLETSDEEFLLDGGATITFDQNENAYYIQDS